MVSGSAPVRGVADAQPRPAGPGRRRVGTIARWLVARPGLTAAAIVAVITLTLDRLTLLPDVGLWDTAEFQAIGSVLGIAHPTGFPSYTLLAWLASVVFQPFGDPALRANLLSAVLAALATGLTAATIVLVTRRWILGVAGGLALAASPIVWSIGLRADAHALHVFLVALIVWLLVQWQERTLRGGPRADRWLIAAAVAFGVAMGNHALTLLLAPGIAISMSVVTPRLLREQRRLVLTCAAALVLTMVALYAYLPIRASMDPPFNYGDPDTLERLRYTILAEQFRGSFRMPPPPTEIAGDLFGLLVGQLGLFGLAAIPGVYATRRLRPALFALTVPTFLITFGFAITYDNADITRYYLVPLLMATLWGAVGLEAIWRTARAGIGVRWANRGTARSRDAPGSGPTTQRAPDADARSGRRRTRVLAPLAATGAVMLLLAPSAVAVAVNYSRVDSSHEDYARAWLERALTSLAPNGVVLSWWSYSTPLWYAQYIERRRTDLWVVDDRTRLDEGLGDVMTMVAHELPLRPVYVILLPKDLAEVQAAYQLRAVAGMPSWGLIYRVVAQGGEAGATDGSPGNEPTGPAKTEHAVPRSAPPTRTESPAAPAP